MAKGRERYEKRQRERAKQEKAAAKRERRAGKAEGEAEGDDGEVVEEGPSEDELLERFRVLNERHAAGDITDDELEEGRTELMEALGFATE